MVSLVVVTGITEFKNKIAIYERQKMKMKYGAAIIGAFALWLFAGPLSAADVMTVEGLVVELSSSPAGTKIAYGPDPLQFGELHVPAGDGPFPVVVFIHGGCWLAKYDITTSRPLAWALQGQGIVAWNLEYRRVGDPGGAYPGTLLDIGSGVDHVRRLAADYPLDLSRVVVMGHSAGGHLALWAGARGGIPAGHELHQPDPIRPAGVVALAPAPALTRLHQQGDCDNVIDKLMGGSPAAYPDRYRYVEPARMAPIGVPQIVIMGVHDTHWTPIGEAYIEAARARGDTQIERVLAPESGHFEVINPSSSTWPLVLDAARALLPAPQAGPG